MSGTYPVQRMELMSRLRSRFDLEPLPVGDISHLALWPLVIPVVQADELLKDPVAVNSGVDLTSAGYVVAQTVPQGERWHLIFQRKGTTSGSCNSAVSIGGIAIALVAATTAGSFTFVQGIVLDEGDTSGINAAGNGGDGNRDHSLLYMRERLS